MAEKFKVQNDILEKCHSLAISLIDKFCKFANEFVLWSWNVQADELAQIVSSFRISENMCTRVISIENIFGS